MQSCVGDPGHFFVNARQSEARYTLGSTKSVLLLQAATAQTLALLSALCSALRVIHDSDTRQANVSDAALQFNESWLDRQYWRKMSTGQ